MDFKGKNVLVTGGNRGIGRATAEAFATAGARVCISFHSDTDAAKEVVSSLKGEGHFAVKADISNPEAVRRMMDAVQAEFSRLDVVVNNAGIWIPHPVEQVNFEEWRAAWEATIGLNLTGPANICYFAGRQMIAQGGGQIINVSSRGAFRGEPEHTAYGASKAGLNSFSQSLAQELAKHKVYVKVIAPGFVETDMTKELLDSSEGRKIRMQSPLNRAATPEEIAHIILFLASDNTEYMTGAIVDVNGASYLRN
jgi:NAD(P)-dependent dehydrogenase (short-subunit alcohol dehydrogenase family)